MMETILKSPSAWRIVEWLTPQYGNAYAFLWLLQVIGAQLDEYTKWAKDFYSEVTPQTATWSISFWEKEYGIVPSSSWTLEQRRRNLMNRICVFLPMNPKRMESLVSDVIGVDVEIVENVGKNRFEVLLKEFTTELELARQEVEKYKPAHLIFNVRVAKEIVPEYLKAYFGAVPVVSKSYHVEVV
jgi:Uncharacterized protein conserved in bacteria (DUF2313).